MNTVTNKTLEQLQTEAAAMMISKWGNYDVDTGAEHTHFKRNVDELDTAVVVIMVGGIRQFAWKRSTLAYIEGELLVREMRGQTAGVVSKAWTVSTLG